MKTGDGQHMGKTRVAQRGFVFGVNAAALAGDDGAGDGAFAFRQRRANARCHVGAKLLHKSLKACERTWRLSQRRDLRRAKGKAHPADAGEKRGAGEIAVAGRSRPGRWQQLRRQAYSLAHTQIVRALAHQDTQARRWIGQPAGADLIQHQTLSRPARIERRQPRRQMGDHGAGHHRRGHLRLPQLGRGKAQRQRRHQRQAGARPYLAAPEASDGGGQKQRARHLAQDRRRLE